jgi:hypothetical protein
VKPADLDGVTAIIGRRLSADRYRADDLNRAIAEDLRSAGLLAGDTPTTGLPPREAATNILACRMSQTDAAAIVAELDAAGMLAAGGPS